MAVQPAVPARFPLTPVLARRSRYSGLVATALRVRLNTKKPGLAPVFFALLRAFKGRSGRYDQVTALNRNPPIL